MDLNPEIEFPIEEFGELGYFIAKASNIKPLVDLQSFLALSLNTYKPILKKVNNEDVLNNFHTFYSSEESNINKLRMSLMRDIDHSSEINSVSLKIYSAFQDLINSLIGPDILGQKSTNLVIQPPGSNFFSELHTDAPGNSEFELVIWIPMVDCYKGKSFYIIDKTNSSNLIDLFRKKNFKTWKEFREASLPFAKEVHVPFGYALCFWTGLLHGSFINNSSETRWTFNTRFKNSFSPSGQKDPFQYFYPIKISTLTKLGLDSLKD